jgi:hypothetical protein
MPIRHDRVYLFNPINHRPGNFPAKLFKSSKLLKSQQQEAQLEEFPSIVHDAGKACDDMSGSGTAQA